VSAATGQQTATGRRLPDSGGRGPAAGRLPLAEQRLPGDGWDYVAQDLFGSFANTAEAECTDTRLWH